MVAVLESLIKRNNTEVLYFFSNKKNFIDKLVELSYFPSASQVLVKMISDEDKNKEEKYVDLKKSIVESVGDYMRKNINDDWFFEGYLEFVYQILEATKSGYLEGVEDFKKLADGLVSR